MRDPLFTPRFFIMCAYSFTVFVSVFQLLPTAPYHIVELGGTTAAAGLFLGLLTYSSAFSAPFTGTIGDRLGQRHMLIIVSLVLSAFTVSYALIQDHRLLLVVVTLHGLFWSGLLSASGAYMTATIPRSRRAEGLGYWGMSSSFAIAVAPALGFWVYKHGWVVLCLEMTALNLLMAIIAWRLPDDHSGALGRDAEPDDAPRPAGRIIEWRVLLLSVSLALISFGYGGLTSFSAFFADELGITPRSLFLAAMAASILIGRLTVGRTLDRRGHRNVLLPCLLAPPAGLLLLSLAQGTNTFLLSALVFGAGFGLMYPAFTSYVMAHVPTSRRGAAFGAMLAAFDTGIGTGSTSMGWLIHHTNFRIAFGIAAAVAALSLPLFLFAERRLGYR